MYIICKYVSLFVLSYPERGSIESINLILSYLILYTMGNCHGRELSGYGMAHMHPPWIEIPAYLRNWVSFFGSSKVNWRSRRRGPRWRSTRGRHLAGCGASDSPADVPPSRRAARRVTTALETPTRTPSRVTSSTRTLPVAFTSVRSTVVMITRILWVDRPMSTEDPSAII